MEDAFSAAPDGGLTLRHPNQIVFALLEICLVFKTEQMPRKLCSQVHVSSLATIAVLKTQFDLVCAGRKFCLDLIGPHLS